MGVSLRLSEGGKAPLALSLCVYVICVFVFVCVFLCLRGGDVCSVCLYLCIRVCVSAWRWCKFECVCLQMSLFVSGEVGGGAAGVGDTFRLALDTFGPECLEQLLVRWKRARVCVCVWRWRAACVQCLCECVCVTELCDS